MSGFRPTKSTGSTRSFKPLETSVERQTRDFKTSSQKLSPMVVDKTAINFTQNSLVNRMVGGAIKTF